MVHSKYSSSLLIVVERSAIFDQIYIPLADRRGAGERSAEKIKLSSHFSPYSFADILQSALSYPASLHRIRPADLSPPLAWARILTGRRGDVPVPARRGWRGLAGVFEAVVVGVGRAVAPG